ncbi:radical SAM family heme chaperone HemW [Candidatus Xianfuyuplasma coldseepsis]|uniref:Heme chaperone HemW n=1 Tax=Candidatus Xianfuyuplasma coldseepsis TaxID=2782163 RepID=A0A7L7KTC1_9MOLU|nr:radical SAM family heme chaperone HemW [Xianfuyuplasma coldseepsis]QMS85855.1 radical SAM family heme chaperone HemW [Xianfuyuplasma coldseepsis]
MLTSLYIHFPFCDHICTYCDFHKSLATDSRKDEYVDALVKELLYRKKDLVNIKTIFLGGGTPLSLSITQLSRIFSTIEQVVNIDLVLEYSIETNPNNVTEDKVQLLQQYHINRVSIGVQTFNPVQLVTLGRDHQVSDVAKAVSLLRQYHIDNISIDLMFSLVHQTVDDVIYDLDQVLVLDVPHISYYALIWEEKTQLYHHYKQGRVTMNSEDDEAIMYQTIIDTLTRNRYNHYEISNFAKPSMEAKHNLTYWRNQEYLGIGSGAHSFNNGTRFYHPANTREYIKRMNQGDFDWYRNEDTNILTDTLIMGMRLLQGIHIPTIEHQFSISLMERFPELQKHINLKLLTIENNYLRFTRKGLLLGNEIFQIFLEGS